MNINPPKSNKRISTSYKELLKDIDTEKEEKEDDAEDEDVPIRKTNIKRKRIVESPPNSPSSEDTPMKEEPSSSSEAEQENKEEEEEEDNAAKEKKESSQEEEEEKEEEKEEEEKEPKKKKSKRLSKEDVQMSTLDTMNFSSPSATKRTIKKIVKKVFINEKGYRGKVFHCDISFSESRCSRRGRSS